MTKPSHYLCVDIGGTKCAVSVADGTGQVLERKVMATAGCEATCAWIVEAAQDVAASQATAPRAAGISCGSPLDVQRGLILGPPNLPGWDKVSITRMLTEATGLPAFLMNDANAGALAEGWYGAGEGCEHFIFLTCGTGMGAGIVAHGRILEGANGEAGEVGHMRLTDDGPLGYGKPGSFEGWCSGGGFVQYAGMSAREATARANEGDPAARQALARFGDYLGRGLAVLVDVLNPERILIGGIYPRAEAWIRPAMTTSLEREALAASLTGCTVMPAALGERIGDLAALAAARHGLDQTAGGTRLSASCPTLPA